MNPPHSIHRRPPDGAALTAAVLEPAPLERHRLREMLRRAGYERMLVASSAPELLRLLKGELVHLILVPWGAPGLSGLELLGAVRHRGRNREVPVVILDDGLPQQAIVSAVKAGAAGRLEKPARAEQLRKVLEGFTVGAEGVGKPGP